MRRLLWLLFSCYAGLASAQDSQPTSLPEPPPTAPTSVPSTQVPPQTPPAPTPEPTPAPTPEAQPQILPPPRAEPIPPKKTTLLEIHALLQGWYDSAPTADADGTFRVRRAQLQINGEVLPKRLKYGVMLDPSKELLKQSQLVEDDNGDLVGADKDDDAALQDMWVALVLPNSAEVSIGQFKIPLSLDGYGADGAILFPERSIVALNFGEKRDLGASFLQRRERYMYTFGLFNGGSLNELDQDASKDIAGRFEVYPTESITLAAALLTQVFNEDGAQKTRLEADFKFEKELLVLVSELHMGTDGDIPSAGGYLAGLVPLPFDDRLQLGARYSILARDLRAQADAPLDTLQELTLGANLYLKGHNAKLQASISRFLDADPEENFTEIIIAAQAWF